MNKICNLLSGLLVCSNSNDVCLCALPLLAGQEARQNPIETGQANSANTLDITSIINLVTRYNSHYISRKKT